jgi:hypothetical protein
LDDIPVTRASADVAGERFPDFMLGRVGILVEESVHGDDETGGAKTALQGVVLPKGFLNGAKLSRSGAKAFDGSNGAAIGLHGQGEARPHGFAVYQHGARSTDSLLTTDMGARESQFPAQKVSQEHADVNLSFVCLSVDGDRDPLSSGGLHVHLVTSLGTL